jgi:hypothetical protein
MMKQLSVSLDENDLEKLKEWFHVSSEDEAVRSEGFVYKIKLRKLSS